MAPSTDNRPHFIFLHCHVCPFIRLRVSASRPFYCVESAPKKSETRVEHNEASGVAPRLRIVTPACRQTTTSANHGGWSHCSCATCLRVVQCKVEINTYESAGCFPPMQHLRCVAPSCVPRRRARRAAPSQPQIATIRPEITPSCVQN